MQFKFLSAIFLILLLVLVAIFNTSKVLFTFLFFKFEIPIAVLIIVITIIGIFIGMGLSTLNELEYKKKIREKNKEISTLKKEIININAANFGKKTARQLDKSLGYDNLTSIVSNIMTEKNEEEQIKTTSESTLEKEINVITSDERDMKTSQSEEIRGTIKNKKSTPAPQKKPAVTKKPNYTTSRPYNNKYMPARRRNKSTTISGFSLTDDYEKFIEEKSSQNKELYKEFYKSENPSSTIPKNKSSIDEDMNLIVSKDEDDIDENLDTIISKDELDDIISEEFELDLDSHNTEDMKNLSTTSKIENSSPNEKSIFEDKLVSDKPYFEEKSTPQIDRDENDAKIFKNPRKEKERIKKENSNNKTYRAQLQEKMSNNEIKSKENISSNASDRLQAIELGMTDMNEFEEYKKNENNALDDNSTKKKGDFFGKKFFKEIFSPHDEDEYEDDYLNLDKFENNSFSMVDDDFVKIDSPAKDEFNIQEAVIKMDENTYDDQINKSMSYDKTAFTKKILSPESVRKQFNWGTNNEYKPENNDGNDDDDKGSFIKNFFRVK